MMPRRREFIANLIAASEVATPSRLLAFVNQTLYLGVQHFAPLLAKDVQDTVEAFQQLEQLALVVFLKLLSGDGSVHVARQIVNHGQRDRRVEIVVHARFKFLGGALR